MSETSYIALSGDMLVWQLSPFSADPCCAPWRDAELTDDQSALAAEPEREGGE